MSISTMEQVAAFVGFALSCYALYVEHKVGNKDPEEEFTALCDIESIGASCSAVFSTPEGRMLSYLGLVPKESVLDVPNAALGVFFYSYRMFLGASFPSFTQIATVGSFLSSIFLAYKLTFVLGDLCLLCWSIHVINSFLMYRTVRHFQKSSKIKTL